MDTCPICDAKLKLYEYNRSEFGIICNTCSSVLKNNPHSTIEELKKSIAKEKNTSSDTGQQGINPETETSVKEKSDENNEHTKTSVRGSDIVVEIVEKRTPTAAEVTQAGMLLSGEENKRIVSIVILIITGLIIVGVSISNGLNPLFGIVIGIIPVLFMFSSKKDISTDIDNLHSNAELVIYRCRMERVESGFGNTKRVRYTIGSKLLKEFDLNMGYDGYKQLWKQVEHRKRHTIKTLITKDSAGGQERCNLLAVDEFEL